MIVVDASALVAIGDDEPEREPFLNVLLANEAALTSINYVEAGVILVGRRRMLTKVDFDRWLADLGVEVRTTDDLAALALEAYLTYGRRIHRAGLNLGDCFAYALAKQLDAPLLYKGRDFIFTDVRPALQPT
ncbi:MAG: type II toxin-antitoxin system VapC family toxin [Caulobacteraceae bacterium]